MPTKPPLGAIPFLPPLGWSDGVPMMVGHDGLLPTATTDEARTFWNSHGATHYAQCVKLAEVHR